MPVAAHPALVRALAQVKHAAALANAELGVLAPHKADAIAAACRAVADGRHHEQFPVDVVQGGAGTSTNMNANEVIANLALEHLGRARGQYEHLDPLDDVNRCQSTNDTCPTALRPARAARPRDRAGAHGRRRLTTRDSASAVTVSRTPGIWAICSQMPCTRSREAASTVTSRSN